MLPEQSNSQIGQSVGAKLRAARIANKLTQSQLASPDFSVSYISAIERGQIHPSLRALEILATRLGLSSTQLLPRNNADENGDLSDSSFVLRTEDEIAMTLLESQIYIWQSRSDQAITILRRIMNKGLSPVQDVQVRYLLGWAYYRSGQFQEGEHYLSESQTLASEQILPYLVPHISFLLGAVYSSMQNYTHAIQSYQQCLEQLAQVDPRDPFFRSQVYTSLGLSFNNLNNNEKSVEMFQLAINEVRDINDQNQLGLVYWEISRRYATLDQSDLARLYAYKCLQLRLSYSFLYLRSEIYHYLGRSLLKGSDAENYLDQALHQTIDARDPLAQACVTAQLAEWHFEHTDPEQAYQEARRANEMAIPYGDTLATADTYLVLGHICYARSDFEQGDSAFSSGLAILDRLQAQEEYADQAAQYGQLLEERGQVVEALAYFRRAFESRQKVVRHVHQ